MALVPFKGWQARSRCPILKPGRQVAHAVDLVTMSVTKDFLQALSDNITGHMVPFWHPYCLLRAFLDTSALRARTEDAEQSWHRLVFRFAIDWVVETSNQVRDICSLIWNALSPGKRVSRVPASYPTCCTPLVTLCARVAR
jgi:hypothetical protein